MFSFFGTCSFSQQGYNALIASIKAARLEMAKNSISSDSCKMYFLDRFENDVFPHWIGTRWDYNGNTNAPGENKVIACGYFVSTTLKHMGFNWIRYD